MSNHYWPVPIFGIVMIFVSGGYSTMAILWFLEGQWLAAFTDLALVIATLVLALASTMTHPNGIYTRGRFLLFRWSRTC